MIDNTVIRKWLAVGIIFLFIGIALAPSINQSVVTASQEDDLIEVTTQACGIQGYGDTTVKMTKQQYHDLEQYLVEFRARLNQTTTREEAIPLFKDAVVELDKYGLLPRGMSVEQAKKLVAGENQNHYKGLLSDKQQKFYPIFSNVFCLLYGSATKVTPIGTLFLMYLLFFGWILVDGERPILQTLAFMLAYFIYFNPIKFMNVIMIDTSSSTNIHSFGLKGAIQHENSLFFLGYTGLSFFTFDDQVYFFGFALAII